MNKTLVSQPLVPAIRNSGPSWLVSSSFSLESFPAEELLTALGGSPIGIAIIDRRLRYVAVNRKLAEIDNVPPAEHLGNCIREVVRNLASTVEARLERVFRDGQPLHNAELSGRLGANRDAGRWLENYFPILDASGLVRHVGIFILPLPEIRRHPGLNRASPSSAVLASRPSSLFESTVVQASISNAYYILNVDKRRLPALTGREEDVLRLLASGASTKEASVILAISIKTVDTYRARLMLKLHATSVAHLVHYAILHQIIALQE